MVKFYTITKVSNYLERPLIRNFHADMFHGLAERDGKEWPKDPHVWAYTESFSPLVLSRTIRDVPEISKPGAHLVVSERLADRLRQFRNIRLAQVEFKRLVDIEWQKGDMSYDKKWSHRRDPLDLLRTLPDVPEFHQQIGAFFEVQDYRWQDIIDRYPSAQEITIEQRTPPMQETEVVRVSPEMLNDFPLFWNRGIFMNRDVFDIFDPFLDRDFFIVRKYEMA